MDGQVGDLGRLWAWFADTSCRDYSPLYDRISRAVAADPEILTMVLRAPPAAHQPNVLLAAVHYLLLSGLDHPLAEVYAGRSDVDPAPLFRELCLDHQAEVGAVMATRRTQTNEVGRSALIGPGLAFVADRLGQPLALVDVGTSAGLNLRCDRYLLDYGEHGATGPADAAVRIACRVVAGLPPIRPRLPPIAARFGIDREPVDLADPDDARWLLACAWPGTGRLARTALAIEEAAPEPPPIVAGDALKELPGVIRRLAGDAVPCVLTTWAFAYLSVEEREAFVAMLDQLGGERPLAWISAEGPEIVDLFELVDPPSVDGTLANVLGAVLFTGEGREPTLLGYAHAHGEWLDWRAVV